MKKLLLPLCLLNLVVSVMGATIRVPIDVSTIQGGIDVAVNGDTVLLSDGVFRGDGNRDISFGGKLIILRSTNGPQVTIIDCEGSAAEPHRGFLFNNNEDSTAKVEGISIQNGYGTFMHEYEWTWGGAIACSSGTPTISNCIFSQNRADLGAAISLDYCPGRMVISDCVFFDNSALAGGAIYSNYANVWLGFNEFHDNDTSALVLRGRWVIFGNVFSSNRGAYGGAMALWTSECYVGYNLFIGNSAWDVGGAMHLYRCSPRIMKNLFFGNSAPLGGALHFSDNASSLIDLSIIAFSSEGEAVFCATDDSRPYLSVCNVYSNAGGDYTGWISNQLGAAGNISSDPLFCDTAAGDFRLHPGSPCVNDSTAWDFSMGPFRTGCFVTGDADGDGGLTLNDIGAVGEVILGGGGCEQPCGASDTDCDRLLSMKDIWFLADHLFHNGPEPSCIWDLVPNRDSLEAEFWPLQPEESPDSVGYPTPRFWYPQ